MKSEYEDFEDFIEWLKKDGLKPRISERLWRKKIFSNLLNGHKKSLINYEDFLLCQKLNSLLGKSVVYKDIRSSIIEVKTERIDCLLIMQDRNRLRIRFVDLDSFIDKYIRVKDEFV